MALSSFDSGNGRQYSTRLAGGRWFLHAVLSHEYTWVIIYYRFPPIYSFCTLRLSCFGRVALQLERARGGSFVVVVLHSIVYIPCC